MFTQNRLNRMMRNRYQNVLLEISYFTKLVEMDIFKRVRKFGLLKETEHDTIRGWMRQYTGRTMTIDGVVCPVTEHLKLNNGNIEYKLMITHKVDSPLLWSSYPKRLLLQQNINNYFAEKGVELDNAFTVVIDTLGTRNTNYIVRGIIKLQ